MHDADRRAVARHYLGLILGAELQRGPAPHHLGLGLGLAAQRVIGCRQRQRPRPAARQIGAEIGQNALRIIRPRHRHLALFLEVGQPRPIGPPRQKALIIAQKPLGGAQTAPFHDIGPDRTRRHRRGARALPVAFVDQLHRGGQRGNLRHLTRRGGHGQGGKHQGQHQGLERDQGGTQRFYGKSDHRANLPYCPPRHNP